MNNGVIRVNNDGLIRVNDGKHNQPLAKITWLRRVNRLVTNGS